MLPNSFLPCSINAGRLSKRVFYKNSWTLVFELNLPILATSANTKHEFYMNFSERILPFVDVPKWSILGPPQEQMHTIGIVVHAKYSQSKNAST